MVEKAHVQQRNFETSGWVYQIFATSELNRPRTEFLAYRPCIVFHINVGSR